MNKGPKSTTDSILGHLLLDPKRLKAVEIPKAFFRGKRQKIVFQEIEQGKTDITHITKKLAKAGIEDPASYVSNLTFDPLYLDSEIGLQGPIDTVRLERLNVEVAKIMSEGSSRGDYDHEKIRKLHAEIDAIHEHHGPEIIATVVNDVPSRAVEWLWYNRIPMGKITILAGDPGVGKSYLSLWMASHVTKGTPWPDSQLEPLERGTVIVMTNEDAINDTIRPRSEAMNTDLKKLIVFEGIRTRNGESDDFIDLSRDLTVLESYIKRHTDLKLVIMDVITDYLGNIKANDFVATRLALKPLAMLAEKYNFALLGLTHMNKDEVKRAMYRIMGSMSFVGVPRSVWVVTRDEDDDNHRRRLFTSLKMNLGPDPSGLAFSISEHGVKFEDGEIATTADQQLGDRESKDNYSAISYAKKFLSDMIRGNPMKAADIVKEAKAVAIGERTLRTAKSQLGIESLKVEAIWYWGFSGDLFQSGLKIES